MLGNWSFGDYFKKEAIHFSWDLLTRVYGIKADRLYVTYFEGNKAGGLEPDLEAKDLWRSVGVAEDHILPGNMKDNFWEMGDQGPCGPCSEIHYDRIGGRNAAHLVNQDDPNVLEIWNNVFIQYNREADKSLRPLPNKHVDTGMGFERLVSVLQDRSSNYDTDVFTPLFKTIQEITGARDYRGAFGAEDADGIDTAYRVVADHVRTLTFAIADGGVPNNVGRGYVVRRVLRRGARYARKYFQTEIGDFFSRIVPRLVEQMSEMFPEIKKKEAEVKEILQEEEKSFAKTLDRGEVMFEKYAQRCKAAGSTALPGNDVWRLYDTYGFPIDLTQLMAEERGLTINQAEVEAAQEQAREASKGEKAAMADVVKLDVHALGDLEKIGIPKTDDSAKFGLGDIVSNIVSIYHNKKFLQTTADVPEGEQLGLLLDKTNFYAEQGGQEYDQGRLLIDDVAEMDVRNVQVFGGYVLHSGYMKYGSLKVHDQVTAEYDELRRFPIRNNHTATHVLNHALREILGEDINQRGSLVAPEKLRFDFSHKAAVSDAELEKIEALSTHNIRQNLEVHAAEVALATAREINGVRAVFGETYPDPVRVVAVGYPVAELLKDPHNPAWRHISVEFCGGTHVANTKDIKSLVVLEESGIAKGIRRILAVTGQAAHDAQRLAAELDAAVTTLEAMPTGPAQETQLKTLTAQANELAIAALAKTRVKSRLAAVAKSLVDAQKAAAKAELRALLDSIAAHFAAHPDARGFVARVALAPGSKAIADVVKHVAAKDKTRSVYLIAGDARDGRVAHGCHVGAALAAQGASAGAWTQGVAEVVGGKAGGREPTSVGSGTEVARVDEGVEKARAYLEQFTLG